MLDLHQKKLIISLSVENIKLFKAAAAYGNTSSETYFVLGL
jgi:hypothetical protein